MNHTIYIATLAVVFSLASVTGAQADKSGDSITPANLKVADSAETQIITTRDGSELYGRIVAIVADTVEFETDFAKVSIAISNIETVRIVSTENIRDGRYWFPNPNCTRLYFAPTARMLKQGEGYFADYYLFFPSLTWGITDYISFGGGMSLFPGIGFGNQLFYFTPKVGVSAGKDVSFAIGALIASIPTEGFDDDDDRSTLGIGYGVWTYGSPERSVTCGLGYGFSEGKLADKPMVMAGFDYRISRRSAFVSENWMIPGVDGILISYGARFFGEGLSIDVAFVGRVGEKMVFPGVPLIDFVINF